MKLNEFMNEFGEKFSIFRNNVFVAKVDGMRNSDKGRRFIDFYPDTDILPEDWVTSESSGEEFYIEDTLSSMGLNRDSVFAKKAYYLTKVEYKNLNKSSPQITFNINDAQNSIIGTQHNATMTNNLSDSKIIDLINEKCGEDREQMLELLSTINAVVQNNIPVQKGTFSRFSDMAAKHSWLLGPMSQKLINHLF